MQIVNCIIQPSEIFFFSPERTWTAWFLNFSFRFEEYENAVVARKLISQFKKLDKILFVSFIVNNDVKMQDRKWQIFQSALA